MILMNKIKFVLEILYTLCYNERVVEHMMGCKPAQI